MLHKLEMALKNVRADWAGRACSHGGSGACTAEHQVQGYVLGSISGPSLLFYMSWPRGRFYYLD